MRIAVTYDKETGNIFPHFGHCEAFKIYEIREKKVALSYVLDAAGSGHEALADFLVENKVDAVICGGIGGGAYGALYEAGILLYGGVVGNADAAINALLTDKLVYVRESNCAHHGEGGCHCHGEEGCACDGEDCEGCAGCGNEVFANEL